MKSPLVKLLLAGFIALGLSAQAAPFITGEITFNGGAALNGSLASATAYTEIFGPGGPGSGGPVVGTSKGDYAGLAGTVVNFTTFTFSPAPSAPFELWSFVAGGNTYSFEASTVVVQFQSSSFLNICGAGVATATGFAPTAGTWSITDGGYSPTFTFGSAAVVPEPSSATLLLVIGSIAVLGRRFGFKS